MKRILTILMFIALFVLVYQTKGYTQDIKQGLFKLVIDNHNKKFEGYPQITGNIYIIGDDSLCESYFRLSQYMEPNLLIFTYITSGTKCWDYKKFIGQKIAFSIDEKAFDELRKEGQFDIGKCLPSGLISSHFPEKVKVVKVIEVELVNGSLIDIPVLRLLKSNPNKATQ